MLIRADASTRRRLGIAYLAMAAGLALWIVALGFVQEQDAVTDHLTAVKLALTALIVSGLLLGAAAAWWQAVWAVPVAVFTAVSGAVTAWFMTVPRSAHLQPVDVRFAAVALPLVVLSSAAVVLHLGAPRVRAPAILLVAVITAVLAAPVVLNGPSQLNGHNLRLAWIGLDVAELATLTSTGVGLLTGRAFPQRSAAAAAALLACDAIINITVTSGVVQLEAVAMAFVELPIAVVSAVVAVRTAASHAHDEHRTLRRVVSRHR